MQLHIEYSRITNQIWHHFTATVQMFQRWMSAAFSSLCIQTRVFTMSVLPIYPGLGQAQICWNEYLEAWTIMH